MKDVIKINIKGLDETIVFWLAELFKNEREEALGVASNEHIFALGSDGEDAVQHEMNAELNREYANILQNAYEQVSG